MVNLSLTVLVSCQRQKISYGDLNTFAAFKSLNRLSILHPAPMTLAKALIDNETDTQAQRFSLESYQCSICLEYTKGFKCLKLSCGDTFCRTCLENFWQMLIKEGDVAKVGCPSEQCVKAKNEASEEEVARVVSEEELRRWHWLKGKLLIERGKCMGRCSSAADLTLRSVHNSLPLIFLSETSCNAVGSLRPITRLLLLLQLLRLMQTDMVCPDYCQVSHCAELYIGMVLYLLVPYLFLKP